MMLINIRITLQSINHHINKDKNSDLIRGVRLIPNDDLSHNDCFFIIFLFALLNYL